MWTYCFTILSGNISIYNSPFTQSIANASVLGLSIDYTSGKLYWISTGNGTVNRCNLDGSGLEVLESMRKQLVMGTALAIMGESLDHDRFPLV